MPSHTILAAVGAAGFIFLVVKFSASGKKGSSPPGPKGWPIIGNAGDLATSPNLVPLFRRWASEYGPIMQFSVLGAKHVIISNEEDAHELLGKRGSDYEDRGTPYAMRRFTRDLNPALMDKSDTWRRQRKLIHSVVSISATKKYLDFMADEATLTLSRLVDNPTDYRNYFLGYCYSVLTRILMGFSVDSAEHPFVVKHETEITKGLEFFRPDKYPSNLFPFLGRLPAWLVPSNAYIDEQSENYHQMLVQVRQDMADAIENGTAKESALRHFMLNRKDFELTDDEADYTFSSLLGGGTRSPYNGMLTILYLMMKFPEWQQRLQDSIDEVVGPDRLPTMDDIPQLPVVRAIVKESIRYRSVVAEIGIPRRLRKQNGDSYKGFYFTPDTTFHSNFGEILMDKDLYPDQQEFNPARWLDPSFPTYKEPLTQYPNCQNFAPFGYGRRSCPGYHVAEMTMVIMVARLAWCCTVKRPVDPVTKKPVELKVEYEPVPNPGLLPFPCEIVPRQGRAQVVKAAAERVK